MWLRFDINMYRKRGSNKEEVLSKLLLEKYMVTYCQYKFKLRLKYQ